MKSKTSVLALLSLLSVITFLDRNAISIAGVRITDELHLSDAQFGWILSAFTISYMILEIPMGLWGDRFGEKKILTRIVLAWSAFTALTGMAGGFMSLFVIRFVFGAGEAGAYPNMAIAIRKWFTSAERGRAQAVIWMTSRIGGALTPLIVIPLQIAYGWRISFYILGIIGIVWVILWMVFYKEPVAKPEVSERGEKVSWLHVIRQGNFYVLLAAYYCYASGVFFFISWLPKYLHNGRGIPENELALYAGFPFFLGALGCLFGGITSDYLVKRIGIVWGRKIVPFIGLGCSGLLIFSTLFIQDNIVAVSLLALGLAFMDVTAPVSWAVATEMGGKQVGAVTGSMNMIGLLAGTITSIGVGQLVTAFGNYDIPVIILGTLLLLGSALWLIVRVNAEKEPAPSI